MFLATMTAFALIASACGGGDDDSGSDDPTSASDDGDSDDGDGLSAVLAAANALTGDNRYRVKYQFSGKEGEEVFEGTFTLSSDPPKQLFRIEGEMDGVPSTISMITDEDSSIICFEGDGPGQCLRTGVGGASPIPLPSFLNAPEFIGSFTSADGVTVSSADGQTIAGQSADCYNVSSPEDGDVTVCVSDDGGQLLSVNVNEEGLVFSLLVLEFGEPKADDFEPAFDVLDIGR